MITTNQIFDTILYAGTDEEAKTELREKFGVNVDRTNARLERDFAYFRGQADQIAKMRELAALAKTESQWKPWLPKDYNAAYLVCIAAGPWKFHRRKFIQGSVLQVYKSLGKPDLMQLSPKQLEALQYALPLAWQKKFIDLPKDEKFSSFSELCSLSKTEDDHAFVALRMALGRDPTRFNKMRTNSKTISLFLRDSLEDELCFPIDRHVRSQLKALGLPVNEHELVRICRNAHASNIEVARYMGTKDLDNGNPDWSYWN